MGISWIQTWAYGTPDVNRLHSFAETLDWYWVVLIPTIGGVATGLIFHYLTDDGRVRSVADVIEGAALHDGRVEGKDGLASAAASLITLSTGGSTGREGPAVHIAAMISSKVCEWVNARGITARDLLGCATGAAVAASFNAPIAGALFALEVILRHFALHAFAPIVIASVAGAVVHQMAFGDQVEFNLPLAPDLQFYVELPAFMGLGLVAGVVAVILMRSIFLTDQIASGIQDHLTLPRWLRPAVAGVLLGLIATQFPVIIGVGYETTYAALSGNLILSQAILFCIIKVVAVSITMGGRMGGGVFSPSLRWVRCWACPMGLLRHHLSHRCLGPCRFMRLRGWRQLLLRFWVRRFQPH
jgi:CIC family chloride channel protein